MFDRLRYLGGSLKARLALASVVLIAASVALTIVLVLRAMEQRSQRAVLDSEIANAERIGLVLSAKIVSLQMALRAASSQVPVERLDQPAAVTAYLDDQKVLRSQFDSVFIADARLHLIAVAENGGVRMTDIDASDRAYIQRTLHARRPMISQPGVSRTSGTPMFVMTMPLFDREGRLTAILIGGMKLSTNALLNDLTRPAVDDHDPVSTIVADAEGNIVSHRDPSWVMKKAASDPHFTEVVAQWKAEGSPIEPQGSARPRRSTGSCTEAARSAFCSETILADSTSPMRSALAISESSTARWLRCSICCSTRTTVSATLAAISTRLASASRAFSEPTR